MTGMAGLMATTPLESLRVLAVDDEAFNLEILTEWLTDQGMAVDTAENGRQALDALQTAHRAYDVILLDRMMPEMDGLEFLEAFNAQTLSRDIPVIMQSAAATVDEVQTALSAGVWYYLSKPFERRKLLTVMETAVRDFRTHAQLRHAANEIPLKEFTPQTLRIQTPAQAVEAALSLASYSQQPAQTAVGLYELLFNAIEHGNLEIGYSEKSRLLNERRWLDEIESRLRRAPYSERVASVAVSKTADGIHYVIGDQGKGFKSKQYLQLQSHRAADNHGRGIAFAGRCFDRLEYQGTGNQVSALAAGYGESP